MIPRFSGWRVYTFVEPPLMLFLFAQALCGAVTTDLMLFRSCRSLMVEAQKNKCDILHTNTSSKEAMDLEALIQPYVSYIIMCKSLVEGIVPAFLSFFLGPWSDRHGRKPLLVAGYGGSAISFLLWTILSTDDINPWFYLLPSIPSAVLGGYCGIFVATFCYITDIRKSSERAWHLTWVQTVVSLGMFLGTITGRFVFKEFGYGTLYATAAVCSALATLHVLFFVPESIIRTDVQGSWCSLFDLSLVKDMIVTCTKKRDGFDRVVAWCCMFGLSVTVVVMEGNSIVGFLFTSARLGWGVDEFTTYMAIGVILAVIGTLVGGKLFRIFIDKNMEGTSITVIGTVSLFAGAMAKALTTKPWHMYLSSILSMFGDLAQPTLRAILSKAAPIEDAGKIFSLTMSMEAIVPLAASPFFTLIYSHNLPPVFPSPVYLFVASLHVALLLTVVVIDRLIANSPNTRYTSIEQHLQVD